MMVSETIKSRADIVELASYLGCTVRGNRMNAPWRDGTKFSVSLDRATGRFKDHKSGTGGSVFDLVMLMHGCDFDTALRWLADYCGIALERQDQRAVAKHQAELKRARLVADDLFDWRHELARFLRSVRNSSWSGCRRIERWADRQKGFSDDLRWSKVAQVPDMWRVADGIDEYVSQLERLPAVELVRLRDRLEVNVAA